MRILLVDDEPALRELLRATFEGAHVRWTRPPPPLEAEARIKKRRPDVIVLDLRMPGMSGAELCTRLKGEPRTKKIPIVLLTGADDEEARRAKRAAAPRRSCGSRSARSTCSRSSSGSRAARTASPPGPAQGSARRRRRSLLYARDLQHLLEVERGQRTLLQDSYLETVTALATALESRDMRTHAHSHRVERYARRAARDDRPGALDRRSGHPLRLSPARRRQDRDPGRDPPEARPADADGAAADADAHRARRADARRRRRSSRARA